MVGQGSGSMPSEVKERRPCWVFDIDGTLADISHRLHFVNGDGPKNWQKFFEGIPQDQPNEPITYLANVLWQSGSATEADDSMERKSHVVCCSGRPEEWREATEKWLKEQAVNQAALYMRKTADYRPDHIVKEELLHKMIEDGWDPILVVDDRQSVVDMWRGNGITCLQVAPNDERNTRKDLLGKPLLYMMVGPSGGGKSMWINSERKKSTRRLLPPMDDSGVLSSDEFRVGICGSIRDQSKNRQVFEALHAVAKTRLKHGLVTVIDATHLKRPDRLASVACAPAGTIVTYLVIDRPLEDKMRDAGWRAEVPGLIEKHHQAFRSSSKDIMMGDGLPNVVVRDLRSKP